jgi:archaeosine-15-forming tRNA-guanine transglycosylase
MTTSLLERIAGMAPPPDKSSSGTEKQARFTALEGTVKIKKSSSSTWINADYNIPLEKGDVVQTGSEGMAKVVFNDGTNYTVKQDSLIVIEENSANEQQQTQVKVAVTTGTVDLSTAAYSQGSKSQVSVAGANVSIGPESAAMVHNDPKNDQHEVLVKKGSGEVSRNGETVHLLDYERASFKAKSVKMAKIKEIGPPTPISPANMIPLFLSGGSQTKDVQFTWTAMTSAAGYRLRISRNPYFSSTIVDRPVNAADVTVTGLAPGAYYWMVQSLDASGKLSMESEKSRFTILPKGKDGVAIDLEIELSQHGHVIEVTGKTETGARVMVNGREVLMVTNDGSFHYFTPPLPAGESTITVTAQNSKGGVNTKQEKVVIQ